jgi:hypothetical protein
MVLSLKPQLFNTEFVNTPSNTACELIRDTNDNDKISLNKKAKNQKNILILNLFIFNQYKF